MPIAARRLTLVLCWLVAAGCEHAAFTPTHERIYAMGTWVDVTLGPAPATTQAHALADIETLLRRFERDYYPWTPGQLADLNAALAEGQQTSIDGQLAALLERARELSAATDGLFEPGLGGLVELWGFDDATSSDHEPPSAETLADALAASPGIAALELDGTRVRSRLPGLKLDLGGIAKGAAVAAIMAALDARGITSALVNAGGDLMVAGTAPSGRPWRIGVRHPREDGLLGVVELAAGEVAFTSGDYERYYDHDGQRLHHLLDPSTGRPAEHTQAVTVLGTDPVLADAAATALFVAGPERWRTIAARLGLDAVLRVDASGAVEMTPAMAKRITPPDARHDMIMGTRTE